MYDPADYKPTEVRKPTRVTQKTGRNKGHKGTNIICTQATLCHSKGAQNSEIRDTTRQGVTRTSEIINNKLKKQLTDSILPGSSNRCVAPENEESNTKGTLLSAIPKTPQVCSHRRQAVRECTLRHVAADVPAVFYPKRCIARTMKHLDAARKISHCWQTRQ